MPYCVISLAATIEDGMVYKVGHSADGSEAYMLDGTDKSLQNWNIATSAEEKIKIFYVKNAKQNT